MVYIRRFSLFPGSPLVLTWAERLSSCVAISVRQDIAAAAIVINNVCHSVVRRSLKHILNRDHRIDKLEQLLRQLHHEHGRLTVIVESEALAEQVARSIGYYALCLTMDEAKQVLLPDYERPTYGELYLNVLQRAPHLARGVRLLYDGRVAISDRERRRTVNLNAAAMGLAYASLGGEKV